MNCTLPSSVVISYRPILTRKAKARAKQPPLRHELLVGDVSLEQFHSNCSVMLRPHIEQALTDKLHRDSDDYWNHVNSGAFVDILGPKTLHGKWVQYSGMGQIFEYHINKAVDLIRRTKGSVEQCLARFDRLDLAGTYPFEAQAAETIEFHYPFVHLTFHVKSRETLWLREGYTRSFILEKGLHLSDMLRAVECCAATGAVDQQYAMYLFAALGIDVNCLTNDQKIDMLSREFGL